jgi:hypothetical protein
MKNQRDLGRQLDKALLVTGVAAAVLLALFYGTTGDPEFKPRSKQDVSGFLMDLGYILFIMGAGYVGVWLVFIFACLLAVRLGVWLYRRYQAWHEEYNRFD